MRTWIGTGILILLLVLGIFVTLYSDKIPEQMRTLLADARAAAAVGQWEKSAGICFQAKALWKKHQTRLAALVDHEPLEEIEQMFSQLEIYLKVRDSVSFCACCASLESLTEALGEVHSVSWWSFL